jgi:hypothetical protein
MELIRIDIEGEGTFVLECNSGQEIVGTFRSVAHHIVSHNSDAAASGGGGGGGGGGVGGGGGGGGGGAAAKSKTKVYSATVAVVSTTSFFFPILLFALHGCITLPLIPAPHSLLRHVHCHTATGPHWTAATRGHLGAFYDHARRTGRLKQARLTARTLAV